MQRGGFWIIWMLLGFHSYLHANGSLVEQKTALPNASIIDSSEGNVRKIVIFFNTSQIIMEQLLDTSSSAAMQSEFGDNGVGSLPIIDGKAISSPTFQQRLDSPSWLLDGTGNGFYFPRQPNFQIKMDPPKSFFELVELMHERGTGRKWMRLQFKNLSRDEMGRIAGLMENPVLAPIQITENDNDEIIVYDLATKTTAYVITRASERMNSAGYLSGCSQPCVVLVRVNGNEMVFSAGKASGSGTIRLRFFGEWQPSLSENALLSCVQKAGRTWVEFAIHPEETLAFKMQRLPDKGILQRVYEAFKGR